MGRDNADGVHGSKEDNDERARAESCHERSGLANEVGVDVRVGRVAEGSDSVEDGCERPCPDIHCRDDSAGWGMEIKIYNVNECLAALTG